MFNKLKKLSAAVCAMALTVSCLSPLGAAASSEVTVEHENKKSTALVGPVTIAETFPDETFREYIKRNFDLNWDGVLSQEELDAVTDIEISGRYDSPNTVQSLAGIQYFSKLKYLNCAYNQISYLDVSDNTALTGLIISGNKIPYTYLRCNSELRVLFCEDNEFETLDVSLNTKLETLRCSGNKLTELNLKENTKLKKLVCSDNQLTSLDLSKNTNLEELYCSNNQLAGLDISSNSAITSMECSGNTVPIGDVNGLFLTEKLPNFDPSRASEWTGASYDAELNALIDFTGSTVTYKYDLGNNKSEIFTLKADSVNRVNSVSIETAFPDETFKEYVSENFDTNGDGVLSQSEILAVTKIDVSGSPFGYNTVESLTGIENFVNLRTLQCSFNPLTSLDLSNNTELTILNCSNTSLSQLNISNNKALTELDLISCKLKSLDVSNNSNLVKLLCFKNQLTSLKLGENNALTTLCCEDNQLTSLDISEVKNLTSLSCDRNKLTNLEIKYNYYLEYLRCSENQLTGIDISLNYDNLKLLDCSGNKITSIEISRNQNLTDLICNDNILSSIDVSQNPALEKLEVNNNQLTSIYVGNNTALESLSCSDNPLTSIDVSKNLALRILNCNRNQLTSLDVSNNSELITLTCSGNSLTRLDISQNNSLKQLSISDNMITSLDTANHKALQWLLCENNQLTSLDLSNTRVLTLKGTGNTYNIGNVNGSYSLSNIPNFDPVKASNWSGADYDASTNSLTNFTSDTVTYDYDCGRDYTLTFTLIANLAAKTNPSLNVTPFVGGADISWNAIPGADMYWLYVFGSNGLAAEMPVYGTSTSVTGLSGGQGYAFVAISYINGAWDFNWTSDDLVYAFVPPAKTVPTLNVTPTKGGADISWNAIPGADMYWLYVFGSNGLVTEMPVYGTSTSVTGLEGGQGYAFVAISYINGAWDFNWTSDDLVYAFVPPAKTVPTLNVTPTKGGANVSWDAIPGADMYWLYVYGSSGLVTEMPVYSTSATVTGLTPGQSYAFVAISHVGGAWDYNWTSDDLVYAVIPGGKTTPKLNASSISGGVHLSWNAVPGAGMYWIYVFGDNGLVTETGVYDTSCDITGLTPGQSYAFVGISYMSTGWDFNWDSSDMVYAFAGQSASRNNNPEEVYVYPDGNGYFTILWSAVDGADMYRLYMFDDAGNMQYADFETGYATPWGTPGKNYAFLVIARINGVWQDEWTADDLIYATAV